MLRPLREIIAEFFRLAPPPAGWHEARMREEIRKENLDGIFYGESVGAPKGFGRRRPAFIREAGVTDHELAVYNQHRIRSGVNT